MAECLRPTYLDCAATTPIDPRVRDVLLHYLDVQFGNAGSRTHVYGLEAAKGIKVAREQIAAVVNAKPEEVIFTSGATEANNLAILGLMKYGKEAGRTHILSTQIEHKAVLEPLERMSAAGFDVELIPPTPSGAVDPDDLMRRVRDETLLVSVMHVNNETGILQPIDEIASLLENWNALLHVDAAQGFSKELSQLRNPRIDYISISGHKICGPKGVGSLVARRRRKAAIRLNQLQYGGGQERGIRPGTLAVPLIAGLGKAGEIALNEHKNNSERNAEIYQRFHDLLVTSGALINGSPEKSLRNCINFSIPGMDSEYVIHSLRDLIAISNGSACTSHTIKPSHVIIAQYRDEQRANEACRISWCHLTSDIPFHEIQTRLHVVTTK